MSSGAGDSCCADYCHLNDDGDAPCQAIDPGLACLPFFEEGTFPGQTPPIGLCIPEP